ncbi:hypothetical protein [[Mycobacterium] appelbergii]|nr:hypothetical protein [Mycobacterium sp. 21AC1]
MKRPVRPVKAAVPIRWAQRLGRANCVHAHFLGNGLGGSIVSS